jgi:ribosome-binding protein aMBF1 (putative translation factor)
VITFDEEMKKLPPERRAKIEARTQELLQEVQIIKEIRQRLGLATEQPTERLNEQQSPLSKPDDLEQPLTLEKLTSVVNALGGEWEITLKFPNRQAIKLTSCDT